MSNRIPPELAGELYCRANIDPMIYNVMNPQIATELLDRAWHMLSQGQISFSFNYIDKPKEGSGFFLKVQPDEGVMAPHDGFQYMDDEVAYGYPGDPRLSITERSQGFATGDQYTHIVRRRYTLTQPGRDTLAFLHYAKAELSRSVVVDARRARTPVRQYPLKPIPGIPGPVPVPQQPPQQGYPQGYRPQQAPPKMASPYAGSPINGSPASPQQAPGNYGRFSAVPAPVPGPPGGQAGPQRLASVNPGAYGSQRHEKKSSHKKHQQQQQHQQPQMTPQQHAQVLAQQQAQAQEDAEEPSGDELDFLTAKDVAVARYKRNHDYIAEVFSPYPTSRIIPPQPEFQQSIAFLKSLSEKHNDDLDAAKTEHTEKIKKFKAEATVLYKGLEELKQATTAQEVFAANERVETFKGMAVQPYTALRQVDLPKDELSRTPELKAARLPKEVVEPAQITAGGVNGGAPAAPVAATEAMEVDGSVIAAAPENTVLAGQQDTIMTSATEPTTMPVLSSTSAPATGLASVEVAAAPVDAPVPVAAPTPATAPAPVTASVPTIAHEPVPAPTPVAEVVPASILVPVQAAPVPADVVMEEAPPAPIEHATFEPTPVEPAPPVIEATPVAPVESTPIIVVPVETPAETPLETPIETPIAAPVETLVAAPVEALVEGTLQTPIDTPMETPIETPTETPAETPVFTPIVAPTEVPMEVHVETVTPIATPAAVITSESATPVTSTIQSHDDATMAVDVIESQPVVGETFVQQSFTSTVGEGDHATTTTSTSYTTSMTDAYGTTVTDREESGGTTVSYADGHQEQFSQAFVHQHHVEHSHAQAHTPVAHIEAAPEHDVASTVTVTELEPSSATPLNTEEASPVVPAPEPVVELVAEPTAAVSETAGVIVEVPTAGDQQATPTEQQVLPQEPAAP
ncbi:hypothetical protein KI688_005708 [Linnemannia hyalina]|uniref:SWI/SNF and RSC complexes subunit Ssr4 C-terminal domain-containing protein n=1 Tax=Linnemannia hyalina TaxID=64524 RepID=A0A9P7Y2C7_9FUNG|nr:hypothetical protein KI688_005708 [Linnemannia hyalina]